MWYLRQSTASQEIPLGPFVDSTDGNTAETGLTIANTDIKLFKTGATVQVNKNSGGATHIANGNYYTVLDATDTDTIGPLRISVHIAGALAVWLDCIVLDEAIYDWLFGTTAPNTQTPLDAAGVRAAIGLFSANLDTQLSTIDTVIGGINGTVNDILADTNELQLNQGNWLTATGFSTHSASDVWNVGTRVLTANTNLNIPTVAGIADAVWDEVLSGHLTAGTTGRTISDILTDTGTIENKVDTIDTVVDSIKLTTDKVDTTLVLDGSVYQFTVNALENAPSGGGGSGDCPTVEEIAAEVDYVLGQSHGAGSWESTGTGTGARTIDITVTDGSSPLENVKVRLSLNGVSSAFGITNTNGEVTLNVDDGTYAVALTTPGYTFEGETLVVNGDETASYAMDSIDSADNNITGYTFTYDENGVLKASVNVYVSLQRLPSTGQGILANRKWRLSTSDVNGRIEFDNLIPGATYLFTRGYAKDCSDTVRITIPANASDPYLLPAFVGVDP